MKLNKSRFQQPARIELLPLIDVIFLLLIFCMFVMLKMSVQSSIKVDLPQLEETAQAPQKMLTITINAHNQIFINEKSSSLQEALEQVIALQKNNKLPILIRGDQQADLGIALSILDKLRVAGFEHVTFAIEKSG